jgi:phosphoglycolate phosphatase
LGKKTKTMHLLFDLDGTLTDPFPGITKCIQHALVSLGRPSPPAENLRWCIGPPLKKSFATLLGSEEAHMADAALAKYRERFGSIGLFENAVYPEIETALDALRKAGYSLGVATSKPTVFAERIVEHFGLKKYFRAVDGSELDGTRTDKTTLIAHILKRDTIVPGDALMIGDREHDMIGARENGVAGLGVLWGYGSREELAAAGAYACAALPKDLSAMIKKKPNQ